MGVYKKQSNASKVVDLKSDEMPSLEANRMFPHEFLYLMTNSFDRQNTMKKLKSPQISIKKVQLPTYEGLSKLDGNLNSFYDLDWLYNYEIDKKERKEKDGPNPLFRLQKFLDGNDPVKRRVKIENLKKKNQVTDLDKEVTNRIRYLKQEELAR